jgi:heme A synthase
MAAYLVAAALCGVAWVRARRDKPVATRLAVILGILNMALFFDIAFNWRWKLHDLLQGQAMADQWYNQRHWPQVESLAVLGVLLLVGMGAAGRRFSSTPGVVLAIWGALLSIGAWSTEVISLHATDMVLHYSIGPLMIVNFVWMLACTMTSIGILKASS